MELYRKTKFDVGQTVYRVFEIEKTVNQKVTCDICCGDGKITYKGYRWGCPKCHGNGELITGTKNVIMRDVDIPRKITSIRLIADKNKSIMLRYILNTPDYCLSSKSALENELFTTMEEAEAYCEEKDLENVNIEIRE